MTVTVAASSAWQGSALLPSLLIIVVMCNHSTSVNKSNMTHTFQSKLCFKRRVTQQLRSNLCGACSSPELVATPTGTAR